MDKCKMRFAHRSWEDIHYEGPPYGFIHAGGPKPNWIDMRIEYDVSMPSFQA